jgi:prevent-host-death family protein
MYNMEHVQSSEARRKMRKILTAVERGEHIEIRRYDTPAAVIVPVEWYERARMVTWKHPPGTQGR